MPVGRILLKSISESNKLSKLKTDGARLLFTWLIPHLNIEGCFNGDPVVVGGKIMTRLKKSVKEIEGYLLDLEKNGLIYRYSSNGDTFLFVPDFKEKQPYLREDREGKTRIPRPTPEQLRTNSRLTPPEIEIEVESKIEIEPTIFDFESLWERYPRKLGKVDAERHFRASIKNDLDFGNISRALDYYCEEIRAKGTEERFIQHGSTWFNNKWRDWVDYKPKGGIYGKLEIGIDTRKERDEVARMLAGKK